MECANNIQDLQWIFLTTFAKFKPEQISEHDLRRLAGFEELATIWQAM